MNAPALKFTWAQLAECDDEHDTPRLGCPVCFLYLLYSQPLVDVGAEACKMAAEDGSAPARAMLEAFTELRARVVQQHMVWKRPETHA